MHRFASGETDIERDTRLAIDAEVALNRGDTMRNGRDSEHGSYAPHNSSRTIHDSRHSIGVPASPNGHVSNNGEDDHTAVHLGAAGGAEGAVELMEDVPLRKQITVEYNAVSAWVPASFAVPKLLPGLPAWMNMKKTKKTHAEPSDGEKPAFRQILFNITGCCRPGEVLAFMGPSGSGKTTLLSIIGGRAQSMMRREGDVLFNGRPMEKRMKRSIGYVMQDDLLYEALTVFEVLWYAAQLRLPRDMSRADKKARVNTVISALGLDSCKNTIVGGFFRKGISGGERKRTSVGHELLINPSLLLLDEPTSGLDSTTAMHLLTSLRKLAVGGRSVITTIHQPSSRLYQQLDKLLLLSQGHAMYYGRASETVEWFAKLGYTLPYRINAADFILDLASADVSTDKRDGEESRMYLIECFETYVTRHTLEGFEAKGADQELDIIRHSIDTGSRTMADLDRSRNGRSKSFQMQNGSQKGLPPVSAKENGHAFDLEAPGTAGGEDEDAADLVPDHRWGATYATQFQVLLSRAVRVRRFQAFSIQTSSMDFSQFIIIAVLAGLFWLRKGPNSTVAGAQQVIGLLFFELLFLGFRALFVALFTFPDEYKMLLKERASGMYRLSAFYFARMASDLPMDMAIPTVFVIILYFMSGLRTDGAKYFFENYFAVVLVMLVCQSFGLLLGTVVMVPKTAQTIASVVMLTFVLTGGYFVQAIPVWISWLKYLSFIYYGFGLLLHIEYNGRTIYSCTTPGSAGTCTQAEPSNPSTNPMCQAVDAKTALRLSQNPNSMGWVALDACLLIMFLVVIRFLTYVALRHKTAAK